MTLQEKLKEFDEQFPKHDCHNYFITDSDKELRLIKDFLASAIKDALEGICPDEYSKGTSSLAGSIYEGIGYDACRDQVKANIAKYLTN